MLVVQSKNISIISRLSHKAVDTQTLYEI